MKLIALLTATLLANTAIADVAVSIRYFKSEGASHYHLFLFQDDGQPIRQLTAPEDAHDVAPSFSKDGRSISFWRKHGGTLERGQWQQWRIGVDGKNPRPTGTKAGIPPEKYPAGFAAMEEEDKAQSPKSKWEREGNAFRMTIPGGDNELVLKHTDISKFGEAAPSPDTRAFQALTIRKKATMEEARVVTDGGSDSFCDLMSMNGDPFLLRDGLHLAFYYQHTGSSGGFRVGALDLRGKRAVWISEENPAFIVPHAKRAGFFSICSERYQELQGTELSVNCLYLDWWDKDLKRTRFADRLALFGGASVRVKGHPQLDIPYDQGWSRGY